MARLPFTALALVALVPTSFAQQVDMISREITIGTKDADAHQLDMIRHEPVTVPTDPRAHTFPSSVDSVLQVAGTATVHLESRIVGPGNTCVVRVLNAAKNTVLYASTPLVGTSAFSTATVQVPFSSAIFPIQVRLVL